MRLICRIDNIAKIKVWFCYFESSNLKVLIFLLTSTNEKCKNNFDLRRNGKFNVKAFIRLSLKKPLQFYFITARYR